MNYLFKSKQKKIILATLFLIVPVVLFFALLWYSIIFVDQKREMWRDPFEKQPPVSEKIEAECSRFKGNDAAVILAIGTSNAQNMGTWRFKPESNVYDYNYKTEKCYVASDPLLGAGGSGGSVWTRLGDKLVRHNDYKNVLIVQMDGPYQTKDSGWSTKTKLFEIIDATQKKFSEEGIKITHIVFAQGEHDAGVHNGPITPAETYKENSKKMIADVRRIGISAPMYFSVSTYCNFFQSEMIRETQRSLADNPSVFVGAETDKLLGKWYRWDNCHFSGLGLERASQMWYSAITGRTPTLKFAGDLIDPFLSTLFTKLDRLKEKINRLLE